MKTNENNLRLWPGMICLMILSLALPNCREKRAPAAPPVPVLVDQVKVKPEPLFLNAVGMVEPIESVAVRAQVGGILTRVNFSEGQHVFAGQVLIQIDPRPFEAALEATQAQLARDQASASNAKIQSQRYADLVKKDYVTKEQYDSARTQAEMLRSVVQADEAAVKQARLNLAYATITAPISGLSGSLMVKKGNVIKANDAVLLVINQIQPIRVSFAIPGEQLPVVQKYSAQTQLEVLVKPSRNGSTDYIPGKLTFVDNAVDSGTGTVTLKAEFANKNHVLWPGQFVDTKLVLTVEAQALTVPFTALVTGQDGTFVYVLGPENKVEKRAVKVNRSVDNVAVIDEGLRAGETVVTDGQLRLVPGSRVEIKTGLSTPGRS